jgi:hypothetical protein
MNDKQKKIEVHLLSQSHPVEHINPANAYTKDGLFCVYTEFNKVYKYPLVNIFRIIEDY